ncbi:Vacuolar protein sorting-associated protein 51 [Chytriomyces hyalinus]|nr:Vacuolar protein sorting-associated protein 51 [Chytriomyces hyalinus]
MFQSPATATFPSLTPVSATTSATSANNRDSATSSSSVSASPSKSKRRDLLKNYYGLSEKDDDSLSVLDEDFAANSEMRSMASSTANMKAASSTLKSMGPNPMDMDSPFFVPETFVSKCVNELSLPEMIAQDNSLVAEIKELDASMKTLVYGNYNKFIAASDTIRDMREKVDDMDAQMQLFSAKMNSISEKSRDIHGFFGEKRTKIRQLTGVHSLLNKLHFVFDLPQKLSKSLQQKDYKAAVQLHAETNSILSHYKSLSLFSKINAECSATMDIVTQRVMASMRNPNSAPSEVNECVWMLGTLGRGFESAYDLADAYLNVMKTQMSKVMDIAAAEINYMKEKAPSSEQEPTTTSPEVFLFTAKIKHWNAHVLKEINVFILTFHEYFLSPTRKSPGGVKDTDFLEAGAISMGQHDRLEIELNNLIEEFLKRYFDQVAMLAAIPTDIWTYKALPFIHVFDAINQDVATLRGLNLFMNMSERVKICAVEHVKKVSQSAFGAAKKGYMDELAKIEAPHVSSKVVLEEANAVLQDGIIHKVFPLLEMFVDDRLGFVSLREGSSGVDAVLEMLTDCFQEFWDNLGNEMKVISGQSYTPIPKFPPTLLILILSRSALALSSSLIDSLYHSFIFTVLKSRNIPQDASSASQAAAAAASKAADKRNKLLIVTAGGGTIPSANSGGSGSYSRRAGSNTPAQKETQDVSPKNVDVLKKGKSVAAQWRDIAKNLAFMFVSVASSNLCVKVRKYIKSTAWMDVQDPVGPSDAWTVKVLGQIEGIDEQLRLVYDQEFHDVMKRQQPPAFNITNASGNIPVTSPQKTPSKLNKSNSSMFASSTPNPRLSKRPSMSGIGSSTSGFGGSSSVGGKFDAMLGNIDLMFQDRADFFGNVEMTREGILSAILRIVVKCYIEELRIQTLGPYGLHHVQVDSASLRRMLTQGTYGTLSEDGLLNNLAEEMITSGMKRCVDPIMLSFEDIDRITRGGGSVA